MEAKKREFFLERSGLFQFGAARETEVFLSRPIGLQGISRASPGVLHQNTPFKHVYLTFAEVVESEFMR